MKTPILFLIFNRPETTMKVFQTIKKARPEVLYVAADGARAARDDEALLCIETRSIINGVDWECEVHTLFREKNLGCKKAVSGALNWFFEKEEFGIILEDDCLPSDSWFPFATEMLERYRKDERVMCISASHFHGASHRPKESYFFSIYNHCWGWASWRRAWKHYDVEIRKWPEVKDTIFIDKVDRRKRIFSKYWNRIFDKVYEDGIDTWDYQWTFCCWKNSGLTILPSKNLVKNIGFGEDATHTQSSNEYIEKLPLENIEFPLSHPVNIQIDKEADFWVSKNMLDITILNYFKICFLSLVMPVLRFFGRK